MQRGRRLVVGRDGHRQRQTDRSQLIDHHQNGPVLGLQLAEHLAAHGFAVEQPLVEGPLPGRGDGRGVVFALADV